MCTDHTSSRPETRVHGEIEYHRPDGGLVHSDICPHGCSSAGLSDEEYRKYLHASLDEWLDKSGGTGTFYLEQAGWERV